MIQLGSVGILINDVPPIFAPLHRAIKSVSPRALRDIDAPLCLPLVPSEQSRAAIERS